MARLVIIAPGRGSYNRTELGYLNRFEGNPRHEARLALREQGDRLRESAHRPSISELDNASGYSSRTHLPGENASALIYSCSIADLKTISPDHKIVAALGNSMGWYTTLCVGGSLSFEEAFRVVDTMGWFQKGNVQGGQVIYPVVNDTWHHDPAREQAVTAALSRVNQRGQDHWVGLSIRLGGFLLLAGTSKGIKALLEELPKITMGANEYPFQLARHGAFHTHLMGEASQHGLYHLNNLDWAAPKLPVIDGRGHIWYPHRTTHTELMNYTLKNQVLEPYDFSCSLRVAIREYNPDHFVLLGPGETLGGSIAQVLIHEKWRGLDSKKAFVDAQKGANPPLIAMNRPEQAQLIID